MTTPEDPRQARYQKALAKLSPRDRANVERAADLSPEERKELRRLLGGSVREED